MIKTDLSKLLCASKHNIQELYENNLEEIKLSLMNQTCLGSNMTGWLDWPTSKFYETDIVKMLDINEKWTTMGVNTVVVIGIGGSYIGPRAIIDMCNLEYKKKAKEIIFVSGLHTTLNASLLNSLKNKNWAIVVISKSGTTFETALNFRLFREKLYQKYGNNHNQRIVAITDEHNGILKSLSTKNNYETLIIPNDIGGRYSTITPVGLFPMLLSGLDIHSVIDGFKKTIKEFKEMPAKDNDAMLYAAARYHLLTKENLQVEVFNTYDNNLRFVSEHYKQIFAESEGKIRNCLIPTVANNSEDLHSIGQLYQQGPRNFFETSLMLKSVNASVVVPLSSFDNDDQLDYIANKELIQLNYWIQEAVKKAHNDVCQITIKIDKSNEYNAGQLLAFFSLAAATSSLLLKVNPFDQPGVENYKNEMKKLIKK